MHFFFRNLLLIIWKKIKSFLIGGDQSRPGLTKRDKGRGQWLYDHGLQELKSHGDVKNECTRLLSIFIFLCSIFVTTTDRWLYLTKVNGKRGFEVQVTMKSLVLFVLILVSLKAVAGRQYSISFLDDS